MATFGTSTLVLNQWKGKLVRVEMMNEDVASSPRPGGRFGAGLVGELVSVYDDAILLKVSNYTTAGTDVEVLCFAQAVREIYLLPPRQTGV